MTKVVSWRIWTW